MGITILLANGLQRTCFVHLEIRGAEDLVISDVLLINGTIQGTEVVVTFLKQCGLVSQLKDCLPGSFKLEFKAVYAQVCQFRVRGC